MMSLSAIPTRLPEVVCVQRPRFDDARGHFEMLYEREAYVRLGIDAVFVQDNHSSSARSVLRGLHHQWPTPQGKLVSVTLGTIFDVAVDVRLGSPTFGQSVTREITARDGLQIWIPPGFAHGFCVLSETAHVHYKVTQPYDPAAQRVIAWDDPELGIAWPVETPTLSRQDRAAPRLDDATALPVWAATVVSD